MNTTEKIDFDPALFGEKIPEAVAVPHFISKKRTNFLPFVFIVFASVIVIIFFAITVLSDPQHSAVHNYTLMKKGEPSLSNSFFGKNNYSSEDVVVKKSYPSDSNKMCDGNETICITTITSKPT